MNWTYIKNIFYKKELGFKVFFFTILILGLFSLGYGIYFISKNYIFLTGIINGVTCNEMTCELDVSYTYNKKTINKTIYTNNQLGYKIGSGIKLAITPNNPDTPYIFTQEDKNIQGSLFICGGLIILISIFSIWYISPGI